MGERKVPVSVFRNWYLWVCLCVLVFVIVFVFVCVLFCDCVYICVCFWICVYLCACVCMYLGICIYMFVCIHLYLPVCVFRYLPLHELRLPPALATSGTTHPVSSYSALPRSPKPARSRLSPREEILAPSWSEARLCPVASLLKEKCARPHPGECSLHEIDIDRNKCISVSRHAYLPER